MSAAVRNYERKDFSYLLINTDKRPCEEPVTENIAGLEDALCAKLSECCRNKKARYNDMIYLFSRLIFSHELLDSFLSLRPVIRGVGFDYFYFNIGENDWEFNSTSSEAADLCIRLSRRTSDGRKQFTGKRLFLSGTVDEVLSRLSENIPDQHCCKPSKEMLLQERNRDQTEARKNLLGDPNVWYIKDLRNEMFHEKSCACVRSIPDEYAGGSRQLEAGAPLCPCCGKAALLRAVIGESPRYLNAYARFFESLKARNELLRRLTLENKTELSFPSPDANMLRAKVNDDTWLIERQPDNTVTLWHNDYQITEGAERFFTGGFHIQIRRTNINAAIDSMCSYSWADHAARITNAVQPAAQQDPVIPEPDAAENKIPRLVRFFSRIRSVIRGLFHKKTD